jgi:hypothetical protein
MVGLRHQEDDFAIFYREHGKEGKTALVRLEEYFLAQIEARKLDASDIPSVLSSSRFAKTFTGAERAHVVQHVRYSLSRAAREERNRERRRRRQRRQLTGA